MYASGRVAEPDEPGRLAGAGVDLGPEITAAVLGVVRPGSNLRCLPPRRRRPRTIGTN